MSKENKALCVPDSSGGRAGGASPLSPASGSQPKALVPNAAPDLVEALEAIAAEAKRANDVIRLNRDGGGQGRISVATAMHRIEAKARATLNRALQGE